MSYVLCWKRPDLGWSPVKFLLIMGVTISIITLNAHYIFNLIIRGLGRRYCQSFSVMLNFAGCEMFGDRIIIHEYWISSVIRRKKYLKFKIEGKQKSINSMEKQCQSSLFLSWNDFCLWNILLPNHHFYRVHFLLVLVCLLLLLLSILLLLVLLLPEGSRIRIQRKRGWHCFLFYTPLGFKMLIWLHSFKSVGITHSTLLLSLLS